MNLTPYDSSRDDAFTVDEFEKLRRAHAFVSDDGDGYWATADHYDIRASVWSAPKPDWATHVAWFSR